MKNQWKIMAAVVLGLLATFSTQSSFAIKICASSCPNGTVLMQDGKCQYACIVNNTAWNGSYCETVTKATPEVNCESNYGETAYENNLGQCVLKPNGGHGKVCPKGTCFNGTAQLCQSYCPYDDDIAKINTAMATDLPALENKEVTAIKQYEQTHAGSNTGLIPVQMSDSSIGNVALTQDEWNAYLKSNPSVKAELNANSYSVKASIAKENATEEPAAINKLGMQEFNSLNNTIGTSSSENKLLASPEDAMNSQSIKMSDGQTISLTKAEWRNFLKANPNIVAQLDDLINISNAAYYKAHPSVKPPAQSTTNSNANKPQTISARKAENSADIQNLETKETSFLENGGLQKGMIPVDMKDSITGKVVTLTKAEWRSYLLNNPWVQQSLNAAQYTAKATIATQNEANDVTIATQNEAKNSAITSLSTKEVQDLQSFIDASKNIGNSTLLKPLTDYMQAETQTLANGQKQSLTKKEFSNYLKANPAIAKALDAEIKKLNIAYDNAHPSEKPSAKKPDPSTPTVNTPSTNKPDPSTAAGNTPSANKPDPSTPEVTTPDKNIPTVQPIVPQKTPAQTQPTVPAQPKPKENTQPNLPVEKPKAKIKKADSLFLGNNNLQTPVNNDQTTQPEESDSLFMGNNSNDSANASHDDKASTLFL